MRHLGARLAAGDQAAFAELYDVFADRSHHYLAVRLDSRPDAEDVLQETFLRLVRNRRRLRGVANLSAYVFTVARNEACRWVQRKQRARLLTEESSAEDLFGQTYVTDIAQRELAEQVARALADLPAEQREVVELKTQGRLTFREIADVTGAPQGTVASRYRAALDNLRHRLVVG
jgi:RNA polymerase sigma-70 factor (ECF subfamily)